MLGLGTIAKKIFGSNNDRVIKRMQPKVDAINALEPAFEKLSDADLTAKTDEFRTRLDNGEKLDDLLVEAFATVREAAKRTLGQRHYDVQLIGGMVLNDGGIAEMKTGEGKTLVATLAAYLNALPGKGCHVVTVNDYLAKRDAEWMGQIYGFLGLTTGVIVPNMEDPDRKEAYNSDITYATNNELGFDYLRDNMKYTVESMVQRDHAYAIVDEVDSILVDEARTPLIISGPTEDKTDLYITVDKLVATLEDEVDYEKDEKTKSVGLTEEGTEKVEALLKESGLMESENLYDYENTALVHHVDQALKARTMFARDADYIVHEGKVVIIDEFTGRMMDGRRYSNGLHQALEAKEGVDIKPENQTIASVTFQNYFRMYPKMSGMTGTAMTEAEEFGDIYGLGVVEIPTNLPIQRVDDHDEFYRTAEEKYDAIVKDIRECQKVGQPVLVGTVSIEKSEILAARLKKEKIKHNVLNARFHEQEAHIVAQGGMPGAVTIATNMAGRGTDIQLGGNLDMRIAEECEGLEGSAREKKIDKIKSEIAEAKQKALDAGGLYVIATERHESRRIDNQLRGRSGRQGDPGRSKFYLSLQDDLMRIFGPERMDKMLVTLGIEEGEAIIHPWINKAIEKAQRKVEGRNYDVRKNLVKYDDVMNDQRKVIYDQRRDVMEQDDVSETVRDMRLDTIDSIVLAHIPPRSYPDKWDIDGLDTEVKKVLGLDLPIHAWADEEGVDETNIIERLEEESDKLMESKAAANGVEFWRNVEKSLLLQVIDQEWQEHLGNLDHLRQAVGLRGYGQKDPLNEYKSEGFAQFEAMLNHSRESITQLLAHIQVRSPEDIEREQRQMVESHIDPTTGENDAVALDPNDTSTWGNVSRNAPCPCGSGKKFKHCHGDYMDSSSGVLKPVKPLKKVGRNELCPCGSGKKYKHCHGAIR